MIEKLYQSYDENNYYISTNMKKLARDNATVIGGLLTFFIVVSAMFVAGMLFFGKGEVPYAKFVPTIIVLIILLGIHRFFGSKVEDSFIKARIYCLIFYSFIILVFSIAEIIIYGNERAVFFPVAIILFSAIYMDYVWVATLYKVLLAIIFLFVDYKMKDKGIFVNDLSVSVLSILGSMFVFATVIRNSFERREDNLELVSKSQTDLLTGLLNKISFQERCEEYLSKRVIGAKCTMFIFDLDDFKEVNDNYGHQTGDKTLKLFAEILKGYFHPDDVIGRIGGDEFMVLVLGEMPEGFADRRCRSVIHELKTSDIDGNKGVTCSIGIVEDTQGAHFEDLYKRADAALYKSKKNGKARFYFDKDV